MKRLSFMIGNFNFDFKYVVIKIVRINPNLLVKNGKRVLKLYNDLYSAKLLDHRLATKELGQQFGFPEDYN